MFDIYIQKESLMYAYYTLSQMTSELISNKNCLSVLEIAVPVKS